MALDTKYRPLKFDDVIGQDATVKVLRRFVETGTGFHQSYLFCGSFGSGKTTMGRILARALLCESPVNGDPCDQCTSCLSLLERGSSDCFVEIDAATNSGKDDVRKIVDLLQYDTYSGRRRIHLFDECFTANTILFTRSGPRTIVDIVTSKFDGEVLSLNEAGEVIWAQVTDWFDLGEREVHRLTFDNGVVLTVTTNQEFFTSNRGWVRALELNEEDELVDLTVQEQFMCERT